MKRLFSLAAFLFALCGLALSAEPKKPAGEGTANAPYQLACYEELLWLAGNAASVSNAYMDLANDIDASASFDEEEFFPGITAYGIHFNGRGHELKNLKFELVKTEYYGSYDFSGSLFKRINNSELTDFALSHMSLAQDIRRSSLHKIVYSVTNDYYFLARAINRTNFESRHTHPKCRGSARYFPGRWPIPP